ncbi:MAG TPA: histidine phosphatase family protein [Longimicrobiales bacterium]|nr:histidine phosphatase family protein [Longimicrobiales bacterium]
MTGSWLRRTLFTAALTLCAAGSGLAQATTTVIVVRHAEKVDDSADPVLSDAGNARAEALADALADAGVSAIITTQFERTRRTAAPLGERVGVTPTVVAANGRTHVADVAARVRELGPGTVVVVGHSNTVPAIIRELGGPDVGEIPDSSYDHLFVLTLGEDGVRLIRSRYGDGSAGSGKPH